MDRKVVEFHYNVLSRGYVDRYNKGEGDLDFNRAGALLHNLWWVQLKSPEVGNKPSGKVLELINKAHNIYGAFRQDMTEAALAFQGSGWVYMSTNGSIKTLVNQSWKNDVVMPIDLFEHSYNPFTQRKDYMKTIWQLIDWDVVNQRLK